MKGKGKKGKGRWTTRPWSSPGRKAMDELFVAVRLHHQLLAVPLHLVELLLNAVQRQTFELPAQRSCSSCYRRSLSLCLSDLFFLFCVWFFFVCSFCDSVCLWLSVGALCVGPGFPSLSVSSCASCCPGWHILCWAYFALCVPFNICLCLSIHPMSLFVLMEVSIP